MSNIVTEVKKIYVFSLIELTSLPDEFNIEIKSANDKNNNNNKNKLKPISSITPEVMMELMQKIEKLKKD